MAYKKLISLFFTLIFCSNSACYALAPTSIFSDGSFQRDRLRLARLDAGLTQYELADRIKVHRSRIEAWESGRDKPPAARIKEMAAALNVTYGYLMGLEDRQTIVLRPAFKPDRLLYARTRAGLTQEKLADRLGVIRLSVYLWEKGKAVPKRKMLPKIARILNVTEKYLLGQEDLPKEFEANKFVSKRMFSARLRAGLTQHELAKELGVKKSVVSKWEQGRAQPTLQAIEAMAVVLKCSMEYLLGEGEELPMAKFMPERLKAARLMRNLSQPALTQLLGKEGVDASVISRWENGARVPRLNVVRLLAEKLGVSYGYLMGLEEDMPLLAEPEAQALPMVPAPSGPIPAAMPLPLDRESTGSMQAEKMIGRLKEFRLRSGHSQKEFGRLLGVSKAFISLLEKGQRELTFQMFLRMVRRFPQSGGFLLGIDAPIEIKPGLFGEKLRLARGKARLTQGELARKLGITAAYISLLEDGQRVNPDLGLIFACAEILNVGLADLLTGTEIDAPVSAVFSDRLRWFRNEASMTQAQLAALSGISAAVLCQYEQAGKVPSPEHLRRISYALDRSVDELCPANVPRLRNAQDGAPLLDLAA